MITEIAIGDAFGRTFEFQSKEFIDANNELSSYKHREGEVVDGIGIYTDDTQMTLAIAEWMISGLPLTQVRMASHMVQAYKRDPRGGYSSRIRKALEDTNPKYPFEFIYKCNAAGSTGNGSVMRTVPLGIMDDVNKIIHACQVHTSVTHGSMDAVNATIATALAAHFMYHYPEQSYDSFEEWMHGLMGKNAFNDIMDSFDVDTDGILPCSATKTAAASIQLAWSYDDSNTMLKKAIEIGGDVDSLAAVSLGLASLRNVPKPQANLYEKLENGPYGRDYTVKLDAILFAKFPRITERVEEPTQI